MREFSKVSPKLWRSQRFRNLGANEKLFYIFLLTSDHQTSAGCFRLPDQYVAADIGFDQEQVKACRNGLVAAELIAHDEQTEEYYILRWFHHNAPTNSNHMQGVQRLIDELESDFVAQVATEELEECNLSFGKPRKQNDGGPVVVGRAA